ADDPTMKSMQRLRPIRWLLVACAMGMCNVAAGPAPTRAESPRIAVRFGPELGNQPLDGRLLVMLSSDPKDDPRLQITENTRTQQIFGIDVEGLAPGQEAVIDEK